MSKVPENLRNNDFSQSLARDGFERIHQGKVRDTYRIPGSDNLLVVATDRISIFDFVLNALIPLKGEVLTALTHFWMTKKLSEFKNHLIPSEDFRSFNVAFDLYPSVSGLFQLERCLVVKDMKAELYPFEMIYRHHIGGSVYKNYLTTGIAGGHQLPKGLPKWSKLEKPIFTPSTKEDVGHDINVDANYFFSKMEERNLGDEARKVVSNLALLYEKAYAYAEGKGILIIDTKFEVAGDVIVDEILTPDSSRFVKKNDWEQAMKEGRDPQFMDKEPIRKWGRKVETPFEEDGKKIIGINNLNPENHAHVEFVHNLTVPTEIIQDATIRYVEIFIALTGQSLEDYQVHEMGVM